MTAGALLTIQWTMLKGLIVIQTHSVLVRAALQKTQEGTFV